MKVKIWCTFFLSMVFIHGTSQNQVADSFIEKKMKELHIPGFEAIAVKDDKIVWTGYYGYQNLEKKIPVTKETLFEAASTSKTITAAAIMQLYATKKIKLDDNINKYLDFKILNPKYPDIPITIRQLLRHRSSIDDNVNYLSQFWETNNGDPKIPLTVFIKDYFSATGVHYDKERNFHNYAPNTETNYSNMGIALLAYLVEKITGKPFEEYCKTNIFQPLDMKNSGWFLKDIDAGKVAMPYSFSDSLQ